MYEPSPRLYPFTVPVEEKLYIYEGKTDDFNDRKKLPESNTDLEIFDPKLETWRHVTTKGHPPPLLYSGACASSGHHLYTYGGSDGSSCHNSLYQLDTRTLTWTKLSSSDRAGKKEGCRMVCYGQKLVLFGGLRDTGRHTNKLHTFDLNEGTWSSPTVSGTRPPPCSDSSFTMVDDHHAVLFGGYVPGQGVTNDVYILDLERMYWSQIEVHPVRSVHDDFCSRKKLVIQEGGPCPVRRYAHTAVCLGYGGDNPQLLVLGGRNSYADALSDAWMLDVNSRRWKEVSLPEGHQQKRWGHCAAAFTMCPGLTEVVIFGGRETIILQSGISKTSVLRFEYQESASTSEWVLTDVAGMTQLGTMERIAEIITKKNAKKSEIIQAKSCTPMTQQSTEMMKLDQRVQEAKEQVKEAEKRMSEAARIAERRLQASKKKLGESKRRAEELERRLGESDRRLRESEERTREAERRFKQSEERVAECEDQLHQLETQWVVKREEIQLTGPELGRGGWATVSVATFRGMQVAAKSIHRQIISRHNRRLFKREMNMAARIRHPNLIQFVGATLEGEMIILMELMTTSLRRELERDYILAPTVVSSISLDVARALNYLHQMQPNPIIHRDISSANVLLEPLPNECWRAKVTDYGSVNLQQQLETVGPGNPTYAAPEANDPCLQSPKMDIFSFGILLIEMLTGEMPPLDERRRVMGTIRHPQLLALIERCLNQRRENRPSASDIISELER